MKYSLHSLFLYISIFFMYFSIELIRESDRQAEANWAVAENVITSNQVKEKKRQELNEAIHPSRKPLHKFFLLISFITSCAALAMLIGQIVGLVFQSNNGPVEYVLRFYTIVLCIVCIMVEYEWTVFGRESKILHFWITRGLYYAFIGVLGLDQIVQVAQARMLQRLTLQQQQYLQIVQILTKTITREIKQKQYL